MVVILSVVNLVIISWFVYKTIQRQEVDFFLWGALFAVFALPGVMDAVNSYETEREWLITRAMVISISFNILFWNTKIFIDRVRCQKLSSKIYAPSFLLPLLIIILAIGIALLIVHIMQNFSVSLSNTDTMFNLNWREVSLDNSTIYRDISHRFLIVGSASVVLAFVQRRIFLFIFSSILVITATLIEGVRYLFAPAFLPVVFYIIAVSFRWKNMLMAGLSGILVLFFIYHVQTLRYQDDRSLHNFISSDNIVLTLERMFSIGGDKGKAEGELRLRGFYYFLLDDMPDNHDFSWGQTYRRLALLPFPTSMLQGIKPTEYTKDIANYIYPEREGYGGTVHPLIYGESYANFGIFSIFVGIFWGFVYGIMGVWYRKKSAYMRIILLTPISIFGIFLARGAVYSSAIFLFYGILMMIVVVALFNKINKIRIFKR